MKLFVRSHIKNSLPPCGLSSALQQRGRIHICQGPKLPEIVNGRSEAAKQKRGSSFGFSFLGGQKDLWRFQILIFVWFLGGSKRWNLPKGSCLLLQRCSKESFWKPGNLPKGSSLGGSKSCFLHRESFAVVEPGSKKVNVDGFVGFKFFWNG